MTYDIVATTVDNVFKCVVFCYVVIHKHKKILTSSNRLHHFKSVCIRNMRKQTYLISKTMKCTTEV